MAFDEEDAWGAFSAPPPEERQAELGYFQDPLVGEVAPDEALILRCSNQLPSNTLRTLLSRALTQFRGTHVCLTPDTSGGQAQLTQALKFYAEILAEHLATRKRSAPPIQQVFLQFPLCLPLWPVAFEMRKLYETILDHNPSCVFYASRKGHPCPPLLPIYGQYLGKSPQDPLPDSEIRAFARIVDGIRLPGGGALAFTDDGLVPTLALAQIALGRGVTLDQFLMTVGVPLDYGSALAPTIPILQALGEWNEDPTKSPCSLTPPVWKAITSPHGLESSLMAGMARICLWGDKAWHSFFRPTLLRDGTSPKTLAALTNECFERIQLQQRQDQQARQKELEKPKVILLPQDLEARVKTTDLPPKNESVWVLEPFRGIKAEILKRHLDAQSLLRAVLFFGAVDGYAFSPKCTHLSPTMLRVFVKNRQALRLLETREITRTEPEKRARASSCDAASDAASDASQSQGIAS